MFCCKILFVVFRWCCISFIAEDSILLLVFVHLMVCRCDFVPCNFVPCKTPCFLQCFLVKTLKMLRVRLKPRFLSMYSSLHQKARENGVCPTDTQNTRMICARATGIIASMLLSHRWRGQWQPELQKYHWNKWKIKTLLKHTHKSMVQTHIRAILMQIKAVLIHIKAILSRILSATFYILWWSSKNLVFGCCASHAKLCFSFYFSCTSP